MAPGVKTYVRVPVEIACAGMGDVSTRTRNLCRAAIAFAVLLGIILYAGRGSGPRRILRGHANVWGVPMFSPDGAIVAALCEDQTFELWDVATGKSRAIVPAATTLVKEASDQGFLHYGDREVRAVFSHDGRLFAALDGISVSLWDTSTGKLVRSLDGDDIVFPSRGGPFVVRRGSTVFVCEERTGEPKLDVGVSREPVRCVMRFIDDDRLLAIAAEYSDQEHTLDLLTFDTATWSLSSSHLINIGKILDFSLIPKGHLLATVATKDALEVVCHDARSGRETGRWDVARVKSMAETEAAHVDFKAQTVFSPSGMVMVEPSRDFSTNTWPWDNLKGEPGYSETLWLCDPETGWCGVIEPDSWSDFPRGMPALTPDGQSLIEVGHEQYIKGAWVGTLPPFVQGWTMKVVPYGTVSRYTLRRRNVRTAARSRTIRADGFIQSLSVAPDGTMIAVVRQDGTILLWDSP